jgi:hypothetical protein
MASRPAAPSPDFLGQATAVEQSRAVAEVHAAVVVAQQRPRDIQAAIAEMQNVCRIKSFAERAFYSYRKAGTNVEGPSIHMARELARIWGNVQHGFFELRRDDIGRYSEMQAVAWDLQSNTRAAQVFVIPHRRDKNKEQVPINDLAGISENNSNMGNRRLRAAIFSILPVWFRDEAIDLCNQTLQDGGGVPLQKRIAQMIAWFGEKFDVTEAQLSEARGVQVGQWTERDVAQLSILGKSLNNGEISKEEAFPSQSAGAGAADEIAAQTRQRPPAGVNATTSEVDPTLDPAWGAQ